MLKSFFQAAALVPPRMKSSFYLRVVNYLLRTTGVKLNTVRTNLGMGNNIEVAFPGSVPGLFLFGNPHHYQGEVGALTLCRGLSAHADTFLDIGANHGYFTFFVKSLPANRDLPVHLYEPTPALFEEIQGNVKRSKLANVHCHREAVSDEMGKASFYLSSEGDLGSSLIEFEGTRTLDTVQVDVLTFDQLATQYGVQRAVVKVDVENAEFKFLRGAAKEHQRIAYLVMEVLGPSADAGFVVACKAQLGMEAYYINKFQLERSIAGEFGYVHGEYNWLFCRLTPDQLRPLVEPIGFSVKG